MNAKTPAVFLGHGSPMIAVESDEYHRGIANFFAKFAPVESAKPEVDWPIRAFVVISAHWRAKRTLAVSGRAQQEPVYDFMGFPRALYELKYNPLGSPTVAELVAQTLIAAGLPCEVNATQGLDHGAWIPLLVGRPQADIPVVQLTLPFPVTPEHAFRVGQALAPLRQQGLAFLGSGDLVHNLGEVLWDQPRGPAASWSREFEKWLVDAMMEGDSLKLLAFENHPLSERAHPSADHLFPLFVILGTLSQPMPPPQMIFQGFHYGTISMTSFWFAT